MLLNCTINPVKRLILRVAIHTAVVGVEFVQESYFVLLGNN